MHSSSFFVALRLSGALATAALLVGGLASCAQESAATDYVPPTMAPEQSVDEACEIAGEEVDRITLKAEAQIQEGIDQAKEDLKAGKAPSLDFFAGSIDDTLAEVQDQIGNREVAGALLDVRRALQNLGNSPKPDTLLGVPGYLTSLGNELSDLVNAGKQLQSLCGISKQ